MACCSGCALSDLEAALPAQRQGARMDVMLGLGALALMGLLLYGVPEKKRARRRYTDPGIRQTRELPIESMREVVHQRRR